jgi:hypothetical protein
LTRCSIPRSGRLCPFNHWLPFLPIMIHDLRHLVRQVLFVVACSIHNRTPLHMSQNIVQLLYKSSSQLGRDIYVALLDQLCRTFEGVAKEAITWLLYAEVSSELPLFIHTAHIASAQTQHPCHCHSATKRSCQHFASGLTASEKIVYRSSPQFAKLRSRSHMRMSIKRHPGCFPESVGILCWGSWTVGTGWRY